MKRRLAICASWILVPLLAACLPESPQQTEAPAFGSLTVVPAVSDSPHAGQLERCLYRNATLSHLPECSLEELPLIGMHAPSPDVETIMAHVAVEKPWMGERFRTVLESLPADFLRLFRSVTGVVIASDIRPSRYLAQSAAIYVDPAYLWQTASEFAQTPQFPDYRSNFGADLQFTTLWRYVIDNEYAFSSGQVYVADRDFNDVRRSVARLLAHELAHAADYLPPESVALAHPRQSAADLVRTNLVAIETGGIDTFRTRRYYQPPISAELDLNHHLRSTALRSTALVRFEGRTASQSDRAYQPADIAHEFQQSGGSDHYNYYNAREDLAMLFEELMMSHFFDIQRDFGVVNNPSGNNLTGADYLVTWGQRGRIADPLVLPRALQIARRILPELDYVALRDALPAPQELVSGRNWYENLELDATGVIRTTPSRQKHLVESRRIREDRLPAGTVHD